MSQQKSSQQARSAAPSTNQSRWRRRVMLGLALGLCLFAALGIAAQQRARQAPRKTEPSARPASVLAPSILTPSTPAKEYIYASGKLIATQEPTVFADVAAGSAYYDDIIKIADREVTLGCGSAAYCPDQNVTREQMAAFIIRALGMHTPPTPAQQRFNDVPPSNPFYAYIEQMALLGITLGCSANPPLYCPTSYVTHGQMAAFMERAAGYSTPPTPSGQTFCDVPPGHQFYAFIEHYAARGIWPGCGGTGSCSGVSGCTSAPKCFCSDTTYVTRREMARILVRNFNL